jgi:uncharacterized protein YjiS (DUF1127 family)
MSMFNTVASKRPFDPVSDSNQPARSVGRAALAFVATGFARIGRAVAKELKARRAMAELARMDEHMLRDLGVIESDVKRVVRYGRT